MLGLESMNGCGVNRDNNVCAFPEFQVHDGPSGDHGFEGEFSAFQLDFIGEPLTCDGGDDRVETVGLFRWGWVSADGDVLGTNREISMTRVYGGVELDAKVSDMGDAVFEPCLENVFHAHEFGDGHGGGPVKEIVNGPCLGDFTL